jgi:hypothetical protein
MSREPGRIYSVGFFTLKDGQIGLAQGEMEFKGDRAFLIVNYWPVGGGKEIKERLGIDPKRLRESPGAPFEFFYRLQVEIPGGREN